MLARKPYTLPEYYGKTLEEHRVWVRSAKSSFEWAPYSFPSERDRINHAEMSLRGKARDHWFIQLSAPGGYDYTWDEFTEFLKNLISDPLNRELDVVQRYTDAKQRAGQKVKEFELYLADLESRMETMTPKMLRDNLLTRLRPDVRQKLTAMATVPETRAALVAVASRIEGSATQHTRGNDSERREGRDKRRPDERRHLDKPAVPYVRRPALPARPSHTDSGEVICYNCGVAGHISRDCTVPKVKPGRVQAIEAGKDEATLKTPRSPPGNASYGSSAAYKRKFDQE